MRWRAGGVHETGRDHAFKGDCRFLSDMVFGKMVTVKPNGADRNGRTVAWIFMDGKNLNEEIVRSGFAWHYKRYSKDENFNCKNCTVICSSRSEALAAGYRPCGKCRP